MPSIVDTERKGDVYLFDFDKGIFDKLGAEQIGDRMFLRVDKVPPLKPPLYSEAHGIEDEIGQPMSGIPITFGNPSDSMKRYTVPGIRINREDPSPALERWMSVHLKYRTPADDANPVTVQYNNSIILNGYDKYEEQAGAWPFDIPYTITVEAAGESARTYAQVLLRYAQKKFPPYAVIQVFDSLGESRDYSVFTEGPSDLSVIGDLRDRVIIYALSLRVSAEFDLAEPGTTKPVTSRPVIQSGIKETS